MFTLPNFCRVCLKYDKNLIDLEHIENEPSETLMSKLEHCVSEVEWSVFKPLLCHPCIKRLNVAYTFKKQCVQSASMLKSYVALVKDTKKKESQEGVKNDGCQSSNAYMMLPNQKYIKIVMGPQSQNTFQNVFLNVVPTTTISPVPPEKNKDTNQNVFLNINNTFQKYIPNLSPTESVNQLLTEAKTEELSVEIDPTDFGLADLNSPDEDQAIDWEEAITLSKVNGAPKPYGNFVPILPKQDDNFLTSGQHFLSSQLYSTDFQCETCQRSFSTMRSLNSHVRDFHIRKGAFKCEFCFTDFTSRHEYESCIKSHKSETDPLSTSITLNDLQNKSVSSDSIATDATTPTPKELADLTCEICHRQLNSTSGLLRHKVRKHNQKSKKKYFIKGMKNAKCDICNREFSTQSYMQLHRKLHLRDDIGYKYKVFGKNRYAKREEPKEEEEEEEEKIDNQNDNDDKMEDDELMVVTKEVNYEDDEEEESSEEN